MHSKFKLLFPFFSLGIFASASGQQSIKDTAKDTKNAYNISEVIIQDNRLQIPFSEQNRNISIIDEAVIKTLPVKSVNELLTFVAGIDMRQRGPWGAQADVSINGGTFDQTLVLLNGVKISDPQTGHNMMNIPVSLNAVDRIEVLKGAAASRYGINALNGAINIITKKPAATGVYVNISGSSSFQRDSSNQELFAGLGMEVSTSLVQKNTRHYLSLSSMRSSGYRYNSALNNNKVFYQNQISLPNHGSFSFMGGYVYNDFGANGFYAAPADVESREQLQTAIGGVNAELPVNKIWTIRPQLSYRYNFDDYIFVRQHPEVYENKHYTHVLDAELNNTFTTGIGIFGIGLEFRNEAINSSNLGKWGRANYGFYGNYNFKKIRNLLMNIGAYVNYNVHFGWQFLPGLDAGYRLNEQWRLFTNIGTGERLPTYTDWYYKGPQNIGNDQLQPEKAFHSELGLKYNNNRLNATASYFYQNTSDFIDWVKDSLAGAWQPQNFQHIKTNGISVSTDYRFTDPDSRFSVLAGCSYTWLNPQITFSEPTDGTISKYALENLRNQVCGRIYFSFFNFLNITFAARYEQRVNYKDYILLDSRLGTRFHQFEAYADISNITDVQYVEAGAIPMPGRWFTLGLKWNWEK